MNNQRSIVVMGVQGAGKSTIGKALGKRLELDYVDGDDLHSAENKGLMAAGVALTDAERWPWLETIGKRFAEHPLGIVIVCSALKREYRDLLRTYEPNLFVVDPEGPIELIEERISKRQHEYMPPGLLRSQFETLQPLQPDERGIIVDIALPVEQIIDSIVAALGDSDQPAGEPA
ncbi:gluconokinase [Lysinibacter cavernae]|uniref:Gluconokinase n=1 Tax=Lysinibacter cavernae TaxID=1640652 RepID=A0A7X5TRZ4_9MICO|nr:gluconokinase [Lysinibacter cavernae]NIH52270.1 carbohydrate kinase (thermoresistant glucokinase family) [Lysinibacter cavernae]